MWEIVRGFALSLTNSWASTCLRWGPLAFLEKNQYTGRIDGTHGYQKVEVSGRKVLIVHDVRGFTR